MTQLTFDDVRYPQNPGYKAEGTSREAAEKVAGGSEKARGQILSLLWKSEPMRADQIAAHFGWTVLYTRPRVSELFKMKAIKKAGRSRNDSGLSANLWTVA
jgi:predicted ArsR family transcriptional regulator